MNLVWTAFAPFGGRTVNASAQVLAAARVAGEILPVTFAEVARRVPQLRADLLLMLGESGREHVEVEHLALNVADGRADEDGVRGSGQPLVPGAPLALASQLAAVVLARLGSIGARASWHAGTYVCNAAYFHALHAGIPAVFVHVPAVTRLGAPDAHEIAQALLDVWSLPR